MQVLTDFIAQLDALNVGCLEAKQAIAVVTPLIAKMCSSVEWLPETYFQCGDEEAARIMHVGEGGGPMVLIDTWPGGFIGSPHDHLTWAVVGCLYGKERNNLYRKSVNATESHCQLELIDSVTLLPGEVFSMLPEDVHSVDNVMPMSDFSVSLHVYGYDLRKTQRSLYNLDTGGVIVNPNSEFQ